MHLRGFGSWPRSLSAPCLSAGPATFGFEGMGAGVDVEFAVTTTQDSTKAGQTFNSLPAGDITRVGTGFGAVGLGTRRRDVLSQQVGGSAGSSTEERRGLSRFPRAT